MAIDGEKDRREPGTNRRSNEFSAVSLVSDSSTSTTTAQLTPSTAAGLAAAQRLGPEVVLHSAGELVAVKTFGHRSRCRPVALKLAIR